MASYRCAKCGEVVTELPIGMIRCPSCASKILHKLRENVTKELKAR